MSAGGEGSNPVDGRGVERRRRGRLSRWRRRTHHPLSACLRLLRGELYPERNRYRDVLLAIALGVTLWAVVTASNASDTAGRATATAHRAIDQVQEGRSTAISLICAVQSGTAEAGREVIDPSVPTDTPFTRFLEQHGYPPVAARQAQSRALADAYVAAIGRHIARELRERGKSENLVKVLLRPNGTLNCAELLRLSKVEVR